MEEKKGREWLQKRAKEWKAYEGDKGSLREYEVRVEKLMRESDNRKKVKRLKK